ncbi:MAG: ABC transporter substrate-binding protein [Rhodospirillales bacterium]|nr:ABC transporter substrate-binding protein [Rhodospirillales bacterium]
MIRNIATTLIVSGILFSGTPVQSTTKAAATPEAVVAEFQSQLVEVMKVSESLTRRERFKLLAPAVDAAFHMPLMVQIAVGSHWADADDISRVKVTEAFRGMSLSTLATLFDGYSGEVFEHQKNNPGPSGTIIVMTDLVKTDKSRIKIAYVTRNFKIGWRIIDVIVDGGISELKVRRSEYRLVLKNKGIYGLIDLLQEKSNQLMAESEPK